MLNTDDFFRCPRGTQELFNVLTEYDVGTVPHNFQRDYAPGQEGSGLSQHK